MKAENEVVSLKLSKKLEEAGYPQQEGLWWWVWNGFSFKLTRINPKLRNEKGYVAPTVAELGEKLPTGITTHKQGHKVWNYRYGDKIEVMIDVSEADFRAKMWLKFKKEDIVNA